MAEEIPLIWTAKGNLPIADLRAVPSWQVTEDFIVFSEQWFLGDELVKSSAHIYNLKPLEASAEQNSVG